MEFHVCDVIFSYSDAWVFFNVSDGATLLTVYRYRPYL